MTLVTIWKIYGEEGMPQGIRGAVDREKAIQQRLLALDKEDQAKAAEEAV